MRKAKSAFIKTISWIIVFVFTLDSCLQSFPKSAFAGTAKTPSSSLNVPADLGTIKSFHAGSSAKTVIYIEDAHNSLEAQEHISKMIHYLVKHQNIRLVFEEGYEGQVPTDSYFSALHPKEKERLSHFFLDCLRLSAAEYAHINRTKDFELIGAENKDLYLESLKQYQKSAPYGPIILKEIEKIEKYLNSLEGTIFSKPFKQWWTWKKQYLANHLSLPEYALRTMGMVSAQSASPLDANEFPILSALYAESRTGDGKALDEVKFLVEENGWESFFTELERLEDQLIRQLNLSDPARKLYDYQMGLQIIKKLARLEITEQEYRHYRKTIAAVNARELMEFIQQYARSNFAISSLWEKQIQEIVRFYELVDSREEALKSALTGRPWETSILVFGGFHKSGIVQVLNELGFSYYVVSPKMTQMDIVHEERYRKLMLGMVYSFEQPFWKSVSILANAARILSLFYMPRENFRMLLEKVEHSKSYEFSDGAAEFNEYGFPLTAKSETRTEKPSQLFGPDDLLHVTAVKFKKLLEASQKDAAAQSVVLNAYLDYLSEHNIQDGDNFKLFLEYFLAALDEHVEPAYLQFEVFSNGIEKLSRLPEIKKRIQNLLSDSKLNINPAAKQTIKETFRALKWGAHPEESFFFAEVETHSVKLTGLFGRPLSFRKIIQRMQKKFDASFDEIIWYAKRLFPEREIPQFSTQDWQRLYRAMAYENRNFKETRLGGFRSVQGRKRWSQTSKRLPLWHADGKQIIQKIEHVFGLDEWNLNDLTQEMFSGERTWKDLSDGEKLMVYGRLSNANKKRFGRLDHQRYEKGKAIRNSNGHGAGLSFALFNAVLGFVFSIFIRLPLHLFEMFLIRYYRQEMIYEHIQKDRDFLGKAKSEEIIKQALSDIRKGKKRISDRWYLSPFGTLSRALDHFWMGSFIKATIQFGIKRSYMAVISAIVVGLLATLGVSALAYGSVVSFGSLAPLTSGVLGLGSVVSFAQGLPILGYLQIPLTVPSIAQAFVTVFFLQVPMHLVLKFKSRRTVRPNEMILITLFKTFILDLIFSPRFWKSILVSTVTMLLVGPEISAIVQYAAAMDWVVFGEMEEKTVNELSHEKMESVWAHQPLPSWLKPVEGVLTGRMHVSGIDHTLEGPVFMRGAALVEHDAMSLGNHIVDGIQNQLGFNLSDWVFHRLGGDPSVSANEVLQAANMLIQRREAIRHPEKGAELSELEKKAKMMESRLDQISAIRKNIGYELLHKPTGEAVEILVHMTADDVSFLAREYAKEEFSNSKNEIVKLGEALKFKSFDKFVSFTLGYHLGLISFSDTDANRESFIHAFSVLAENPAVFEESSLRALAGILDDVEPAVMAEMLRRVAKPNLIQEALARVPLIHMSRKDRVAELGEKLEIKLGKNSSAVPEFKFETKTISNAQMASQINQLLLSPFDPKAPNALRENADRVELFTQYGEGLDDVRIIQTLEAQYQWLVSVQAEDGSFPYLLGFGEYAASGKALFELSRFFGRQSQRAKDQGGIERSEHYQTIAEAARVRALRTADFAYLKFRQEVHLEDSKRGYSKGHNYPEMIHLFDEAYQATGEKKWYQMEKHIAENIVRNRIVLSRKLFPEYEEVQVRRPYLTLDGGKVDLFKAIYEGVNDFRFIVKERSWIPPFEVGFNEELGGMIEESKIQEIKELEITREDGSVIDHLKFKYSPKGVLEKIESQNGTISYLLENKSIVKQVSVYHIEPNSGVPYGISYQYVHNVMGELQYIIKENVITLEGTFEKHPVHTIVKDAKGEAMKDLDIPQGLRPDGDRLRAHEGLDSAMRLDAFGRSLQALYRVKFRADEERDWKLATDAQTVAYAAVKSFYDHNGKIRQNSDGLFLFFDKIDSKSGALNTVVATAEEQANLLNGLAPWSGEIEQARQVYQEGIKYFRNHPDQITPENSSVLKLSEMLLPQPGKLEQVQAAVDSKLKGQVIDELKNMLNYGRKTVNFKFADIKVRKLQTDETNEDSIFLSWEPIQEARWYLVREYRQDESGTWVHIERNDQWSFKNYLNLEDPSGVKKRYVVMGFTADPIFESFGPFHGTKSMSSEAKDVVAEPQNSSPGNAYMIVGKKHLVGSHEEWIDLTGEYKILAKEFLQYPHSKGAEWEIAKDRHFKHMVKKFYTTEEIPELFLKGLENGDYYIRVRVWSGEREALDHPLTELKGSKILEPKVSPVENTIQIKEKTVIEWKPVKNTGFYRVKLWFREGNLDRFIQKEIFVSEPFVDVRKFTSKPVNRIEITAYTADPRLGGIAGPTTGPIDFETIEGAVLSSPVQDISTDFKSKNRWIVKWKPVSKASIYRIESMSRSSQDEETVETFWSSAFASEFQLTKPVKFVRIQAWTDHPENGGQPITEHSPWINIGVEFERPEPVKAETIRIAPEVDQLGNKRARLTFDRVDNVEGYSVMTRHKRGSSYYYWVPQTTGKDPPSVDLAMDADYVEIFSTTKRIQGKVSDVTNAYLSADVSFDDLLAPFEIIKESSVDLDQNGIIDPTYFFYDLNQIPPTEMKVYIQYATKLKNEETIMYGAHNGNVFYPAFDADRVKARLVWMGDDGRKILSDWSEWRNIDLRVKAPAIINQLDQIDFRTVHTEDIQSQLPPEQKIIGYTWETKTDFNEPEDQTKTYRTTAKFYNGVVYDKGTELKLSSPARYVRAKAVYWTPQGEIVSPKWSSWKEIDVKFDEPDKVQNIHFEDSKKILFDAHKDPKVNAYIIETSDDPYAEQSSGSTYTRRIIKETIKGETVVVKANNFFDLPVKAKYVRVTPAIVYDDDDKILGKQGEWILIQREEVIAPASMEEKAPEVAPSEGRTLGRVQDVKHSGRWIIGKHVPGANFYQIETRDRNSSVRTTMHTSPVVKSSGDYVAFRVKPVNGFFESGEFEMKKDGEWSAWNFVKEVEAPLKPKSPENVHVNRLQEGQSTLAWKAEFSNTNPRVPRYSYYVEMEDRHGNRIHYGPFLGWQVEIPFEVTRARIKAVKTKNQIQSFLNPTFDSESDWTPWVPISEADSGRGPESIELEISSGTRLGATGTLVHIKPDPNIPTFLMQAIGEDGRFMEDLRTRRDSAKTNNTFFYPDHLKIAKVRVIGRAGYAWPKFNDLRFFKESPAYAHRWVDVPGRELRRLDTPQVKTVASENSENTVSVKWDKVQPLQENRRVFYRIHGIRSDGQEMLYPATDSTEGLFGSGADNKYELEYIAIEAVQTDEARIATPDYDSAFSNLIPLTKSKTLLTSTPLVEHKVVSSELLTWPKADYEIKIREKGTDKPPVVITSLNPYAPDALIPKGKAAYDVEVNEITAYRIDLTTASGEKKSIHQPRHSFSLNLSDLPPDTYQSIRVRYLTHGEFLGTHGKWAEPRGIHVEHEDEHLLYIRPTGEKILTAVFSDGFRVDFDKKNKQPVRAYSHDGTEVKIEEIPGQYKLKPEEIFDFGEQWTEVTPKDEFKNHFYNIYYRMRNLVENKTWSVAIPPSTLRDNPTNLLGVSTSGVFHVPDPPGKPSGLDNDHFFLNSKQSGGSNPGAMEDKWSSGRDGIDVYTRKYLIADLKAAVFDLSVDSAARKLDGQSSTLALQISPKESTGKVSVKNVGDYRVIQFGTGEFIAVHKNQLAGWYLGPQAEAAMRQPKMANGETSYSGLAERAVLYIRVPIGRFQKDRGEQGTFEPELGDLLNRTFIYSGEANTDEDLSRTLNQAVQQVDTYEKTVFSMAKHQVRDGRVPKEFLDQYFFTSLQNSGWNHDRGTYWEMLGSGNPKAPVNSLPSNASWTGNSSLVQQLNVQAYPILVNQFGSDRINDQGESLLDDRIIPNADWIFNMMTPTDSTYMKVADRMRLYYPQGLVLIDNQQISAVASLPNAVVVKRGYEPLEAFTISGSGFGVQAGKSALEQYNLHDPNRFYFQLSLPEDVKVDSSQEKLHQTRIFHDSGKLFEARENLELKKGEYALRYDLELDAKQPLHLSHTSVALSRLDAEQDIDKNPEQFPGFQGENGLVIAGVDEILRARNLFEAQGLTEKDKGQWIDLLSLFQGSEALAKKGAQIREKLKRVGAIGVTGWDKEGVLYLKEGIDYDRGYRVMVKMDEREDDSDEDHIIEFTDLRVDIPVEKDKQQMKAGDQYQSPTVYFTNFWVRLGVTDQRNVPEDLKHMMFDWIHKIDHDIQDGLSMESDYAYTESVIALWTTANFLVDQMLAAHAQGKTADETRYRTLAAKYALAAMRGTVSSRDVDRSIYDTETGLVREDIMNSKGIMRFYGTFTVSYGMARDFIRRMNEMTAEEPALALFSDPQKNPLSIYDAIISDALRSAQSFWDRMNATKDEKEALRAKAYAEIYLSKVAKFTVLKAATDKEALQRMIEIEEGLLKTERSAFEKTLAELTLYHAQKQLAYFKSFGLISPSTDGQRDLDYWYQEILLGADRILKLQQLNKSRPNYGGFYQNEQPSKMQLDDNGTKLWALRVALEMVDHEIQRIVSEPGIKILDLKRLYDLYQKKSAYRDAAYANIKYWVRSDPRDGHLFGWESAKREEDYDSQRTPYGNETYRLRGLGSWMDILPEAKDKFDRSSKQHTQELPDGRRLWSPRGIKMTQSFDNPGDGTDTSTEILPTAIMAFLRRASGGTFRSVPVTVRFPGLEEEETDQIIKRKNYYVQFGLSGFGWFGLLTIIQSLIEINLLKLVITFAYQKTKHFLTSIGKKTTTNRFIFYQLSILAITVFFIVWQVNLVNLDATNLKFLILMTAMSAYVVKNVGETIVRYFRLGMLTESTKVNNGRISVSELENKPFPQGPLHLASAVSVPLFTVGEDARISHGTADQNEGTFHNMALKNLSEENRTPLIFHINDQSPDRPIENFNPKAFHEEYFRGMNQRVRGKRFFYTHQSGNSDKKFGAVQAMDNWWYALKRTIREIVDEVWDGLSDAQKSQLMRAAYGVSESVDVSELENNRYVSKSSDLVIRSRPDGKVDLSLGAFSRHGVFLAEGIDLPASGEEIQLELRVPRRDGLTAVLPVWIRRSGEQLLIYHFNEHPDGDNVLIDEVLQRKTKERSGLLPIEKQNMIEEEARALLYRFWASEYGSTETIGDDVAHGALVTSGKAEWLSEAERIRVHQALEDGNSNAEHIFLQTGIASRLSEAMAQQSSTHFSKVRDIGIRNGLNLEELVAVQAARGTGLFPEPFDERVRAWTDVDLLNGSWGAAQTVPFEMEVGKQGVPGQYYHFSPDGDRLEVYHNPALGIIDETTRTLESIQQNSKLSVRQKKSLAKHYLKKANQILRQIREIAPVKRDYRVRYNHKRGQTEILEETWTLYEYQYENGRREVFFKAERKVRFDTVVGHIPTVGPLAYIWRFDNDETVDLEDGHSGTLQRGPLIAGHPRTLPVVEPNTYRTVTGYGGMTLPVNVGNAHVAHWSEMAARNRSKSKWDLLHQWNGFGEVQYTGTGIENLDSAERAKTDEMTKGKYKSHDMRETGELGPAIHTSELLRGIHEEGLTEAFFTGRSHSDFTRLEAYVKSHFMSQKNPGHVVFMKYGRELTLEAFVEILSYGSQAGGFALLDGLEGYEQWFTSLKAEWQAVMGRWKEGDNQWLSDGFGGVDIRGVSKLPGAMPGFVPSPRRSLEQTVVVFDGNISRVFMGQDHRENPLTDTQKYFISRTFEEDQRGAVMFLWLIGTLILAALNHKSFTLFNLPILSYLALFAAIGSIIGIMKFAFIFKDIRKNGFTSRNTSQMSKAVQDVAIETIIFSGFNLWKALNSTVKIIFRVPTMKWVTSAQSKNGSWFSDVKTYTSGALMALAMVSFIVALHPNWTWLTFGGLFLSSLLLGPILARVASHKPETARFQFKALLFVPVAVIASLYFMPGLDLSGENVTRFLMVAGFRAGMVSTAILAALVLIRFSLKALEFSAVVVFSVLKGSGFFLYSAYAWISGAVSLIFSFNYALFIKYPLKKNFSSVFQLRHRFAWRAVSDYFFVKGADRRGFFSNSNKALGNLILMAGLWSAPLIAFDPVRDLLGENLKWQIILTSSYLGLFFPVGFWLVDHLLSPLRSFRILNPFDWIRSAFHVTAAVTGNVLGLGIKMIQTIKDMLSVPYLFHRYRKFVRIQMRETLSRSERNLAQDVAIFLKNNTNGFRRKAVAAVSASATPERKISALIATGLLDDRMIGDLATAFHWTQTDSGIEIAPSKNERRSELRQFLAKDLDTRFVPHFGPGVRSEHHALSDLQALSGAIAIDAKSFIVFSTEQQHELINTAISRRAKVVIYHDIDVPREALENVRRFKEIKFIPEGLQRASVLLAGYPKIVNVFSEDLNPQLEPGSFGRRVMLFRQIEGERPGLITAALLKADYGERYNLFKHSNGVYSLIDETFLDLVNEFLAHELIHQSA